MTSRASVSTPRASPAITSPWILQGKVTVHAGSDDFESELGPWCYVGQKALTTDLFLPDFAPTARLGASTQDSPRRLQGGYARGAGGGDERVEICRGVETRGGGRRSRFERDGQSAQGEPEIVAGRPGIGLGRGQHSSIVDAAPEGAVRTSTRRLKANFYDAGASIDDDE